MEIRRVVEISPSTLTQPQTSLYRFIGAEDTENKMDKQAKAFLKQASLSHLCLSCLFLCIQNSSLVQSGLWVSGGGEVGTGYHSHKSLPAMQILGSSVMSEIIYTTFNSLRSMICCCMHFKYVVHSMQF